MPAFFSVTPSKFALGLSSMGLLLSLLSSCAEETASGSCTASREEYGFSQDSSRAYSMSDVLSGRRESTATLSWGDPKDWLPHPGMGETELVIRLKPTSETAVEIRSEAETDCERTLQVDVEVEISTADGVLLATADGVAIAYSEERFELEVEITPDDLDGTLQISGMGGLQLLQIVEGSDVEGELRAWKQQASGGGSSQLRTGTLASWQGSVGAEAPEPDDAAEPDDTADDATVIDDATSDDATSDDATSDDASAPDAAIAPTPEGGVVEGGIPTEAGLTEAGSLDDAASGSTEAGTVEEPAEAGSVADEGGLVGIDAAPDAAP